MDAYGRRATAPRLRLHGTSHASYHGRPHEWPLSFRSMVLALLAPAPIAGLATCEAMNSATMHKWRTVMVTSAAAVSQNRQPDSIDLQALKAKQQAAWSSGDYSVVGTTLQIVGEELCEALDLRSG